MSPTAAKSTNGRLSDRVPPHDLDAELSVFGSVVLVNGTLDDVRRLIRNGEAFYSAAHRLAWQCIVDLDAARRPIDAVTLAAELQSRQQLAEVGGPAFIGKILESVPHAAHAEYYAGIVADRHKRRQLIDAATETLRDAYGPIDSHATDTAGELIEAAERRFLNIGDTSRRDEPPTMAEALLAWGDVTDANALILAHSGFRYLDENLDGGFRAGQLIVPAGRPGDGKTALLQAFARWNSERLRNVLFVSCEMSRNELIERLLSTVAHVPHERIRRRDLDELERAAIVEAQNAIARWPLRIAAGGGFSMASISSLARRMKRRQGLDLLIIDYLQLIAPAPDDRRAHREVQVAGISRDAKRLAGELGVPIVLASQVNREVEKRESRRPRLADLRESGAIEQDADIVLLLHREAERTELIVAKQRGGKTGSISLDWRPVYVEFRDGVNDGF